MLRSIRFAAAIAVLCGLGVAGNTAGHPLSRGAAARAYLAVIGPADRAGGIFSREARGWTNRTPLATLRRAADALLRADQAGDRRLLAIDWPLGVRAHVRRLVTADTAVEADLRALGAGAITVSSWRARDASAEARVTAAANVVRVSLGLPRVR